MPSKSKSKGTSSPSSSLVTLATLWMATVSTEASRGAWGSSHHLYGSSNNSLGSSSYSRRHNHDDLPSVEFVRDSFCVPGSFSNSLMRQQYGDSSKQTEKGYPRFDVSEGEDGTTELTMELPGLSARDLNIEVENDHVLRVSGVRTHRKNGYIHQTEFNEAVRLKDTVDVDRIQSHISSGVLTITIPEKPKKIKKVKIQGDREPSILDAPPTEKSLSNNGKDKE